MNHLGQTMNESAENTQKKTVHHEYEKLIDWLLKDGIENRFHRRLMALIELTPVNN